GARPPPTALFNRQSRPKSLTAPPPPGPTASRILFLVERAIAPITIETMQVDLQTQAPFSFEASLP
ncbi:MAG: hypothetical protein AAF961_11940, partial [Planctomycetota bacterium]